MILSHSFIQYLFPIFLIYYISKISSASTDNANSNVQDDDQSAESALRASKGKATSLIRATYGKDSSPTSPLPYVATITKAATKQKAIVLFTQNTQIDSTRPSQRHESTLPILLGFIFSGLAIAAVITSILIYISIKKGYIGIFNQSQTQIKDLERNKLTDSVSTNDDASLSRR